jgi:Flp pilus assembly pilin Flp
MKRTLSRQRFRAGLRARVLDERGSATAEYAIATLAAVGFAGLLVVILRSDAVRTMLTNLIQHALSYSQ